MLSKTTCTHPPPHICHVPYANLLALLLPTFPILPSSPSHYLPTSKIHTIHTSNHCIKTYLRRLCRICPTFCGLAISLNVFYNACEQTLRATFWCRAVTYSCTITATPLPAMASPVPMQRLLPFVTTIIPLHSCTTAMPPPALHSIIYVPFAHFCWFIPCSNYNTATYNVAGLRLVRMNASRTTQPLCAFDLATYRSAPSPLAKKRRRSPRHWPSHALEDRNREELPYAFALPVLPCLL